MGGRNGSGNLLARWTTQLVFFSLIDDVPNDRRPGRVARVVSRPGGPCQSRVRSFLPHFHHGGSRRATKRHGDSLRRLLGTRRTAILDWPSRWVVSQFGAASSGLLEAFYAGAVGGTAPQAAVSPWSFAALALSPCIKKFLA